MDYVVCRILARFISSASILQGIKFSARIFEDLYIYFAKICKNLSRYVFLLIYRSFNRINVRFDPMVFQKSVRNLHLKVCTGYMRSFFLPLNNASSNKTHAKIDFKHVQSESVLLYLLFEVQWSIKLFNLEISTVCR